MKKVGRKTMSDHLKMKIADPEQVTDVMINAIRQSVWFAAGLHGVLPMTGTSATQFVPNLVRDIAAALTGIGVVMIQPDLTYEE
jgi:hypothetical protein